jgi:hypothetical protein
MHDSRVGRFFAVDTLEKYYAEQTPYQFSSNAPIHAKELEGMETAFDMRFERRERRLLAGKITPEQFKAENNAEGVGALAGVIVITSFYTGGRTLPLLESLFWTTAIHFTRHQLTYIAAGNLAIGFFDESGTIQTPGPIDDFGRSTRLVVGTMVKSKFAQKFIVKVGKLDFLLGNLSQKNLAKDTKNQLTNIAKSIFRSKELEKGGIETKEQLLGLIEEAFNSPIVKKVTNETGETIQKQVTLKNGTKVNFYFLTKKGSTNSELTTMTIEGKNKEMDKVIDEIFDKAKELGNDLKD